MEEQLKQVFCQVLQADPGKVHDGLTPDELPKWDSLHHLNLIVSLEERFRVAFTIDEMNEMRSSFGTVRAVLLRKVPGGVA